jgi:hypothetical protein
VPTVLTIHAAQANARHIVNIRHGVGVQELNRAPKKARARWERGKGKGNVPQEENPTLGVR